MRLAMKTRLAEMVRSHVAAPLVVGVVALLLYARCLYPDVAGGDAMPRSFARNLAE